MGWFAQARRMRKPDILGGVYAEINLKLQLAHLYFMYILILILIQI